MGALIIDSGGGATSWTIVGGVVAFAVLGPLVVGLTMRLMDRRQR